MPARKVYKFLNDYSSDFVNKAFHLGQNTNNLWNVYAFTTDVPRNNCLLDPDVHKTNQLLETLFFDLYLQEIL